MRLCLRPPRAADQIVGRRFLARCARPALGRRSGSWADVVVEVGHCGFTHGRGAPKARDRAAKSTPPAIRWPSYPLPAPSYRRLPPPADKVVAPCRGTRHLRPSAGWVLGQCRQHWPSTHTALGVWSRDGWHRISRRPGQATDRTSATGVCWGGTTCRRRGGGRRPVICLQTPTSTDPPRLSSPLSVSCRSAVSCQPATPRAMKAHPSLNPPPPRRRRQRLSRSFIWQQVKIGRARSFNGEALIGFCGAKTSWRLKSVINKCSAKTL